EDQPFGPRFVISARFRASNAFPSKDQLPRLALSSCPVTPLGGPSASALARAVRRGCGLSMKASQHALGPRHTALDCKHRLTAVIAAGANLIGNKQHSDCSYEQSEPHMRPPVFAGYFLPRA